MEATESHSPATMSGTGSPWLTWDTISLSANTPHWELMEMRCSARSAVASIWSTLTPKAPLITSR